MKENKYKINIDNIYCDEARRASEDVFKIQPFDGVYIKEKLKLTNAPLPEKKALEVMNSLKKEMQSILDSYVLFLSSKPKKDDW
jgi:hypothetical protein